MQTSKNLVSCGELGEALWHAAFASCFSLPFSFLEVCDDASIPAYVSI